MKIPVLFKDAYHIFRQHGARALGAESLRYLAQMIERKPSTNLSETAPSKALYHHTFRLSGDKNIVPSRRPINDQDFAIQVPLNFPVPSPKTDRIAVIIHVYYVDLLPQILGLLGNIPGCADVFISTDTVEKQSQIERLCLGRINGSLEIRVFENRGRDIAPKIVGFRDVYERYEFFLHLHTKLSPHGGRPLSPWRDYLLHTLLGSEQIVGSILALLGDERIGVVYAQHLYAIRGILNWGYDYPIARPLLARMGIELDKDLVLEFPSGSMFWGRSAALRPLLDLNLRFSDFPDELGQHDGTLAHAVERSFLMSAEIAGFEWMKVARRDLYPLKATVLPIRAPAELQSARLKVFQPCLSRVESGVRATERAIPEVRALLAYPSRNDRPRVTLLIPTVNPRQTFGGVATGLKVYREILDALGDDFDARIVATDAAIEPEGYSSISGHTPRPLGASTDETRSVIIDAFHRQFGKLDLRENDIFIATAWWTAQIAFDLMRDQERFFKSRKPVLYLIQDDEPYFYGWSSKWALAQNTYLQGSDTVAIINSEELYDVMTDKYSFAHSFCIPYALNNDIDLHLAPLPREREILVYGRPSVSRNVFEIIHDGIFIWQQRNPTAAAKWRVVSLGESFPASWCSPIQNITIGGKQTLAQYADHLNRASVGIALMLSPHPSYPPLEMAEAGLITISNRFEGKDLGFRFPDIISLEQVTGENIAIAIEEAVMRSEPSIGKVVARRKPLLAPVGSRAVYDPLKIAGLIRDMYR